MSWLEVKLKKVLPGFKIDVQWEMERELTVLFGYSGSGKSLTLQMLAGLLEPDEGTIGIGYVFQHLALFPHMTIHKNIEYALRARPHQERKARCGDMMRVMEIHHLADKNPREISGGQQQRVALARALVSRPRLLVLDEPFTALDTPLRLRMRRLLLDIRRIFGTPMIMVTHDLYEARALADRIVIYSNGRVLRSGTPDDALSRVEDSELADLLSPPLK
jgi:molybdate transport system ATP-binding protein